MPEQGWDRERSEVMYRLDEVGRLMRVMRDEHTAQFNALAAKVDKLQEERIGKLEVKVGQLEVKAGIFGGIGGLLAAAIVIGAQFLGAQ